MAKNDQNVLAYLIIKPVRNLYNDYIFKKKMIISVLYNDFIYQKLSYSESSVLSVHCSRLDCDSRRHNSSQSGSKAIENTTLNML